MSTSDGWSRSVKVEPEWFVVRCLAHNVYNRQLRKYENVGGGCGYIDKHGRRREGPVFHTKKNAQRIAAKHRAWHREDSK